MYIEEKGLFETTIRKAEDAAQRLLVWYRQAIRKKVEVDLLDAVKQATPQFFEKLVVELLVKARPSTGSARTASCRMFAWGPRCELISPGTSRDDRGLEKEP